VGLPGRVASRLGLLAGSQPPLVTGRFLFAMGVLGVGLGALSSQLGNVVQSAVGASERSEAGGLQYTAPQFGAALGTALMGAVVIGALASGGSERVSSDPRLSQWWAAQAGTAVDSGVNFG